MPGRMKIQKFLDQASKAKCQYVVLEVTSEGIKQHRHRFINFDLAVFTNLTEEHLESHGGFENYKKAKAQLFKALKPNGKIIVNLKITKKLRHSFLKLLSQMVKLLLILMILKAIIF